ncbi:MULTISPECIES: SafA/ExsA family spore coat assembly protein [Pontibacillus]|uniref:SafA/ExsA family spore coat assembly protein n=1 Tax=Pontibacillus chungwhensis TaxID=265426 RepID=A0ABY8V2H6_9BACI|nr:MULTISPECIES: SafA/ExsA family spore coat assembly protein [Pontibacillus]MCD5324825.1 SafA/ExsA family spore coat assembly protein [Pontibacillus sp. HN14]WIF98784.1 SafA/ExsA family spore coat assembly protein [Pontibacillus chungwhensis]
MKKMIFSFLFAIVLVALIVPGAGHAQSTDTYTVKSGDTLWKISQRYKIGLSEIISANPQFSNPDLIYPGDRVTIPLKGDIKSVEQEVIRLTNKERAKQGLPALKSDWQLSRVARYKSRDMRDQGYFAHNSPTYGSPFEMMKSFNISYRKAAENIAAGQRTPQEVVQAWMDSPGHRKNILDKDLTYIGVGYAEGGSYGNYWTQQFITK